MTPRAHRSRRSIVALAATALMLSGGLTLAAPAGADSPNSPGHHGHHGHGWHHGKPARTVDVMSRNLYLGANLTTIIDALATGDPATIVGAATQTWNEVQASDPVERMGAVADEIVATRPAAIGLQEVTTWSTYAYDAANQTVVGGPTVAYDFLELLVDALADRGVDYEEVSGATAHNFASPPIPVVTDAAYPTSAVQLADRDVILVRSGVKATNAHQGSFVNILAPPVVPLAVARGWGSADLRVKKATFRFVNTHLEAWGPEAIRIAQVGELVAAQDAVAAEHGRLPKVWVGDYNSDAPTGGAYQALISVLSDAWTRTQPDSALGFTSSQAPLLDNTTSELYQRIDLVLTSSRVKAKRTLLTGITPVDLPGDTWWASDHAGVVAKLLIRPHRSR